MCIQQIRVHSCGHKRIRRIERCRKARAHGKSNKLVRLWHGLHKDGYCHHTKDSNLYVHYSCGKCEYSSSTNSSSRTSPSSSRKLPQVPARTLDTRTPSPPRAVPPRPKSSFKDPRPAPVPTAKEVREQTKRNERTLKEAQRLDRDRGGDKVAKQTKSTEDIRARIINKSRAQREPVPPLPPLPQQHQQKQLPSLLSGPPGPPPTCPLPPLPSARRRPCPVDSRVFEPSLVPAPLNLRRGQHPPLPPGPKTATGRIHINNSPATPLLTADHRRTCQSEPEPTIHDIEKYFHDVTGRSNYQQQQPRLDTTRDHSSAARAAAATSSSSWRGDGNNNNYNNSPAESAISPINVSGNLPPPPQQQRRRRVPRTDYTSPFVMSYVEPPQPVVNDNANTTNNCYYSTTIRSGERSHFPSSNQVTSLRHRDRPAR